MENYIQYLTQNNQVKTLECSLHLVEPDTVYLKVSNIKESFSIISVFYKNIKRYGVSYARGGNLESLSFINSNFVDVELVPVSSFENSESEIIIVIPIGSNLVRQVSVNNFPVVVPLKFYKVYDSPQYRTNNFLTNSSLGTGDTKWLTQNVYRLDFNDLFQIWNSSHFDNFNGVNDMAIDYDEWRVLDRTQTFMLNGMYVKFTCLKPTNVVSWYHFRLFQDVRTNEVYLTYNTLNTQEVYNRFDYNTLKCVDGGFSIEKIDLGLKVEIRNKYFV